MSEPSLFDDLEGGAPCQDEAGESPDYAPRSEWHEVPQATFLAWSERRQLEYCAARDEDSAAHEDDPERRAWYLWRANAYKEMIECLT